jgi:transcriptional regulator with XRE-family HTH domain
MIHAGMLPHRCYKCKILSVNKQAGLPNKQAGQTMNAKSKSENSKNHANAFGDRIRELRKSKGYSLRKLAPLVGVGFSYLSKVENGRLDSGGSPSESLIHRLADALDADEEELLLLAHHVPETIAQQIFDHPDLFRALARCNARQLQAIEHQTCGATK